MSQFKKGMERERKEILEMLEKINLEVDLKTIIKAIKSRNNL